MHEGYAEFLGLEGADADPAATPVGHAGILLAEELRQTGRSLNQFVIPHNIPLIRPSSITEGGIDPLT
jgi:hypothetical protein